jgi:cobalt-zinc-cadmium efflux system membrane fusion protein
MSNFTNKLEAGLKSSPVVVWMKNNKKQSFVIAGFLLVLIIWLFSLLILQFQKKVDIQPQSLPTNSISVSADQAKEIKVGNISYLDFEEIREAVGLIDFDKNHTAEVYSPYQGRVAKVFKVAGDDVKEGDALFTVLAPDAAQASAALVSSAGVLKQANETLKRAQELYDFKSISLKEYQQNLSDQQTAEGNYLAAKKSMELFGFTQTDIAEVIAGRKVDIELSIRSPYSGRVVSRAVAVGQLVQPGNGPAPFVVSDTTHLWMVANVPESEIPLYHVGQSAHVKVQAYMDKLYSAKIIYVADSVDPVTHRLILRAKIDDPRRELRANMLASFVIGLNPPINSIAIPETALVRDSDGSRIVWVTNDGKNFTRRIVKVGIFQAGYVQILDGLKEGDSIALTKAIYLSNLYSISR